MMFTRSAQTLVITGLVLAACFSGSAGATSFGLPVKDGFSNCSKGWSTDSDRYVSLGCTGGTYRVLIKNPQRPQSSRVLFKKGVKALNVEADALYKAGTKNAAYGVSCWGSPEGGGYLFLVSPAAAWVILKWTNTAAPTDLAGSPKEHAIAGFSRVNRIRGECIGGGKKPTVLALYVNGKKIAAAEDRRGLKSFSGVGLTVLASRGGTDVRFDNFVAR